MKGRLVITTFDGDSIVVSLEEGVLSLGRAPGNSVSLNDPFVSDFHAEVRALDNGVSIVDLDSAHGTMVNGKALTSSKRLLPGDEILLGNSVSALLIAPTTRVAPAQLIQLGSALAPGNHADLASLASRLQEVRKELDTVKIHLRASEQRLAGTSETEKAMRGEVDGHNDDLKSLNKALRKKRKSVKKHSARAKATKIDAEATELSNSEIRLKAQRESKAAMERSQELSRLAAEEAKRLRKITADNDKAERAVIAAKSEEADIRRSIQKLERQLASARKQARSTQTRTASGSRSSTTFARSSRKP